MDPRGIHGLDIETDPQPLLATGPGRDSSCGLSLVWFDDEPQDHARMPGDDTSDPLAHFPSRNAHRGSYSEARIRHARMSHRITLHPPPRDFVSYRMPSASIPVWCLNRVSRLWVVRSVLSDHETSVTEPFTIPEPVRSTMRFIESPPIRSTRRRIVSSPCRAR